MNMEKTIELLWEHQMETAIMQAQRSDSQYMEAESLVRKEQKKITNKGLRKKQFQAVDKVISAQNNVSVEFGRLSYCQGFRDCFKLIVEATNWGN